MRTFLALILLLQDDLSPQAKELMAALEKIRAAAAEYNEIGTELQKMREDYPKADDAKKKELETAFKTKSERAQALRNEIGTAIRGLQRDLERAVKLAPDDLGLVDVRCQLNEVLGDDPAVEKDLEVLLGKRPDHAPYVVRKAGLDRRSNRYADARRRLEPFVKKGIADAIAEDGLSAYALNDFDGAVDRLETALKGKFSPELKAEVEVTLKNARERKVAWAAEGEIRKKEAGANDLPRLKLVTARGDVEIELFENEAPVAVANFVALAERKFFDGTRFHRVMANFMVQGGDPLSKNADPKDDGTGGPGYAFDDELPEGKYRRHFRGSLSMANSGPNTNGSQFFVSHRPTEWLDGKHVVFGRVVSGMEIVDNLKIGDELKKVEVIRKRSHEYKTPK